MQWADSASLELLKQLLSDDRPQSLLFVGAYRDNEVDANHPLTATLKHIRTEQTAPVEISMTPLEAAHVAQLIADTVATTVDAAMPLAQLVARNTEGCPLFVREYLKALFDDGLLRFERGSGQLRRLGPEAQTALTTAAAIGNRFPLSALASLSDTPLETMFETLLPALRAGVVVTTSEAAALAADGGSEGGDCRFFHDRVQQAAYSLLDDAERAALHLRIGRMLLAAVPADERGEDLFEIVHQLNRAVGLITDPAELIELAELNLQASRKASSSGAYAAAGELLEVALEAIATDGWQTHHELTMSIHRELATAEHLVGHHDRADDQPHDRLSVPSQSRLEGKRARDRGDHQAHDDRRTHGHRAKDERGDHGDEHGRQPLTGQGNAHEGGQRPSEQADRDAPGPPHGIPAASSSAGSASPAGA